MRLRSRAVLVPVVVILALFFGIFQGCRKERPGFERNLPPETFLSSVPVDSSFVFYRVKLYWGGLDPDGQVVGYYYAVTDSNLSPADTSWVFTTNTEQEFSLLANNPEMLGHRFYCIAVDNEGLTDPSPAFIFFYARDFNLPKVRFTTSYSVTPGDLTIPITARTLGELTDSIPGDTIPTGSVLSFAWQGWDEDPGGYVTGYFYKISDEATYSGGTLADTSYSYTAGKPGTFNFEVAATDDAGARSRRDTLRYYQVNHDCDTWITSPGDTCKGFWESGSIPRCEGETLRLIGNVEVSFAWDNWDQDGYVIGSTHRLTRDGGGPAFRYTEEKTWETALSASANYEFLVRCRDNEGKDEGTPASVKFYTNCAPFFFGEKRCCTCPGGIFETCSYACTNTVVIVDSTMVYDSLNCPACDVEDGVASEYRVTLNGRLGSWRVSPVQILTKDNGLQTGWNTLVLEAKDRQPDGSFGRTARKIFEFYVDVEIP
jgi:hypothetical protein